MKKNKWIIYGARLFLFLCCWVGIIMTAEAATFTTAMTFTSTGQTKTISTTAWDTCNFGVYDKQSYDTYTTAPIGVDSSLNSWYTSGNSNITGSIATANATYIIKSIPTDGTYTYFNQLSVELVSINTPGCTSDTITLYYDSMGVGTLDGTLTINVSIVPSINLSPTTLSAGKVGTSYSAAVAASGGTSSYTYAITSGSLPTGLSLSSSGAISGTPTTAGSYTFTVTATDSGSNTGSQSYTLVIAPNITIPTTLSAGKVGTSYSATLTASGGTSPYTYAVTSGSLPAGLSLSSGGAISGTPTTAGSYTFTVTATDSSSYTGSQSYTVVIAPDITLSPTTLSSGTVGTSYSTTLTASGGTSPYTYAVTSGSLPAGLSLSSGVISGTPTTAGSYTFTVTATDNSSYTGSQSYTLVINSVPTITLTPTTLSAGTVGTSYSATLTASGGASPYTYSVTGSLPTGLSLSSSGAISGTPTAVGSYTFTVTATDSSSYTGSRSYILVINSPAISITPTALSAGTVGTSYSASLTASGGTSPYTYAVTSGSLPTGLSLSNSGAISGTPTTAGSYTFTVTATDSYSQTAMQSYTLTIQAIPAPTAQNATVNVAFNSTGTAIDMSKYISGTYTSVSVATSPSHGSATAGGSIITYTPSKGYSGTDSFTYNATGPGGTSADATVSIIVAAKPDPSKDTEVQNTITSQVNMAKNFVSTQISNLQGHLEHLHSSAAETEAAGRKKGRKAQNINLLGSNTESVISDYAGNTTADSKSRTITTLPSLGVNFTSRPNADGLAWWSVGSIQIGKLESESTQSSNVNIRTSGITLGADRRISSVLTAGGAVTLGRQYSESGDNGSNVRGISGGTALYSSWHYKNGNYIDAMAGYQRLKFNTERYITASGEIADSIRYGNQWYASIIAGHEYKTKEQLLGIYSRLTEARTQLEQTGENSSSSYALTYAAQHIDSCSLAAGIRVERKYPSSFGVITPKVRLEFQHEFQTIGSAYVAYSDDLSTWYQIVPQSYGQNVLNSELGFDVEISKSAKTSVVYNWHHYLNGTTQGYLSFKYMYRY